jgi:hypothetical protein
MIDELAKALCENAGWRWGRHPVLDERYRRRVRTVLRRLREPSPMMKAAAVQELSDTTVQEPKAAAWDALRAYKAMIDAAMGGG